MNYNKRRLKYISKHTEDINILRESIDIKEPLLDLMCAYSISQNTMINRRGLSNLYTLMQKLGDGFFENNQSMAIKYKFMCEALKLRTRGLNDRKLIMSEITRVMDVSALDDSLLREISEDEVNYVDYSVGEMQNLIYIERNIGSMFDVLHKYKEADFRAKRSMITGIRDEATKLVSNFRKFDLDDNTTETLFRLSELEGGVADIHRQVTSPTFKLVTGMVGLNFMLGGGFEAGNVYSFFGLPGEGKTVTLENILYQLWKYNKGYECRDKTKKPCIVLLTMENFVRQTVCALFHIMTKGTKNIRDCKTADEAIQIFKDNKFIYDNDDNNSIEIVIKYKPVNSINTDYMYKIVDDLLDDGYECIAFLQDYVKRILPVMHIGDPYQDLGNVVNDFKTFATLRHMPVITASQLNREAAKIIDEGRNANKQDLLKKLSRANIGESARIDENLDGTFIITPEVSADKRTKYMGFKMTKHRYEIYHQISSIYQPYYDNSIAMVEDVLLPSPVYKESLLIDNEESNQSFTSKDRNTIHRAINGIQQHQLFTKSLTPYNTEEIETAPSSYTFNSPIIETIPLLYPVELTYVGEQNQRR